MNKLSGKVRIPDNVANYRLMDRQVLNEVLALQETNRVFRIEVPYVGFKTGEVLFKREERVKGESKYNFKMMYNLALSSVVSVTNAPLHWLVPLTITSFVLTCLSILIEIIFYICYKNGYNGINQLSYGVWLIVNVMMFIASFIFLALSVVAIYLSEAVTESRKRPPVIINKVYKK